MKKNQKIAVEILSVLEVPRKEKAGPYLEIIDAIDQAGEEDFRFTLGNKEYRAILDSSIDEIMQEELESDLYMLGCFNAWFLADILDIDQDIIEEMQKAEAYTAVGKLVMSLGRLEKLQKEYVTADGYGHHFGLYDGNEEETGYVEDKDFYHIFRTN